MRTLPRVRAVFASQGARLVLLALACGAPGVAPAQPSTQVDAIVVTATKRETKLLQTPMSVTVLDRATLQATNADNAADFASLVAGLSYSDSGPGQKRYALRGL